MIYLILPDISKDAQITHQLISNKDAMDQLRYNNLPCVQLMEKFIPLIEIVSIFFKSIIISLSAIFTVE